MRLEIVNETSFSNNLIYCHQNFNAKLSAFALARAEPFGDETQVKTRVFTIYEYAAPEYIMTGIF